MAVVMGHRQLPRIRARLDLQRTATRRPPLCDPRRTHQDAFDRWSVVHEFRDGASNNKPHADLGGRPRKPRKVDLVYRCASMSEAVDRHFLSRRFPTASSHCLD